MNSRRVINLRMGVKVSPLQLLHASQMYEWMLDPMVSENLGLRTSPTLEKTLKWIDNAMHEESICPLAVQLDDQYVGNVVLDRIDNYLASARLSIYIGEASARRSGVGLTAIYCALEEGFTRYKLHKIWLTVHNRNIPAIKTYLRFGFVKEGILRDEFKINSEYLPLIYMGLMQDEFERIQVEWKR
jgi:RimJ/RimL family protein N-acetyltransferase